MSSSLSPRPRPRRARRFDAIVRVDDVDHARARSNARETETRVAMKSDLVERSSDDSSRSDRTSRKRARARASSSPSSSSPLMASDSGAGAVEATAEARATVGARRRDATPEDARAATRELTVSDAWRSTSGARATRTRRETMENARRAANEARSALLRTLSEDALSKVCDFLSAKDLASLECTSAYFYRPTRRNDRGLGICERAARIRAIRAPIVDMPPFYRCDLWSMRLALTP